MTGPLRALLLDDYQHAALDSADWSVLAGRVEVEAEPEHIHEAEALVERLASYDVVVAMRERTPLPATVLDRLPRLRLLVTTGMRNASIDVAAARANGVTVCGTSARPRRRTSTPGRSSSAWPGTSSRRLPTCEPAAGSRRSA